MRWELMSSQDKAFILAEAVVRGWEQNKVQVKYYDKQNMWTIEPYEENCKCPNLVLYKDYIEGNI